MKLEGSVAFVTGANRGLGEQFVRALFDAGAAKVYAGARDPGKVAVPGRSRWPWTSPTTTPWPRRPERLRT